MRKLAVKKAQLAALEPLRVAISEAKQRMLLTKIGKADVQLALMVFLPRWQRARAAGGRG